MRVLYLTEERITHGDPLVRGGAIHVQRVCAGLSDRGHDVLLVDWNDDPADETALSVAPRLRVADGALRTLLRTLEVCRTTDVDAIVSKTRKTYHAGWLAGQLLDVPHVVHVGSSLDRPASGLDDRFSMAWFGALLSLPHDGYLVVCEHVADQLAARGVDRSRIYDVGNAVDTERFHPDRVPTRLDDAFLDLLCGDSGNEGTFTLGFIGGIHDYKGVHDLAAAIDGVEADVRLVVAGDGPAKDAFAAALGDRGVFLGSVPYEQIPALYHQLDGFVLPSHTEGLPRVVLEAQATGTPVVATAVGGVPDVVTDGETGLLCPPRDPRKFSAALGRLVADEQLRERLQTAGRRQVEASFTWESLYDRYEQALEAVVRKNGR
jgi:glycosyltransferase involved in cell wall biosynthesis